MKKDGYIFISLVMIISLVGVLSVSFSGMLVMQDKRHKEEELKFSLSEIQKSIDDYNKEEDVFPKRLDDLIEERYLRREYKDPFVKEKRVWRDSWDYDEKSGIISSKSKVKSLKGTPYNKWIAQKDGGVYIISETGE